MRSCRRTVAGARRADCRAAHRRDPDARRPRALRFLPRPGAVATHPRDRASRPMPLQPRRRRPPVTGECSPTSPAMRCLAQPAGHLLGGCGHPRGVGGSFHSAYGSVGRTGIARGPWARIVLIETKIVLMAARLAR
jgi:hypothetical protein